jgi:importin subunit beta-1
MEIATDGKPLESRQMASIFLKNTLYAKSASIQQECHDRWKRLDSTSRQAVKDTLSEALRSNEGRVPHFAAVAMAEIACVELPYNEWPTFVQTMTDNLASAQSESIQLASLECLGFTCERIEEVQEMLTEIPSLLPEVVDRMLTTIVHGVHPERSDNLRLAALQALKNSLAFVSKNMDVKTERDVIINAICESTRCGESRVRALAYECFDQIAELYYDKLPDYMTAIFQLTTEAIKTDTEETVKMAAIEFWSTIAWIEQSYFEEEIMAQQEGRVLERPPSKRYVQNAMSQLVPLLLESLSRQDDELDLDTWNLHAAGAVCLESISQTVEGAIVPVVIPFVQQNISSENWRLRDAAIIAFTCIHDGPDTDEIGLYVNQSIAVLLNAFTDASQVVRDSATHCIASICKLHIRAVQPDQIRMIIQGLIGKLKEAPILASHACSAIFNIGSTLKSTTPVESNLLSAPMLPLMQSLLEAMDREDAIENNLRVASMSAAAELISASALDVQPILRDLLPAITGRMAAALRMDVLSNEDKEVKEQLLGLLCGLVTALFQKIEKADLLTHADSVMELLIQVLQVPNANCHEEAFLSIGAVASAVEEEFVKYLQVLMPFLVSGLRSYHAYSICIVCVGVIVDICAAVGGQIQPYCDDIMAALTDCLKDGSAQRDIKPAVISCFGDIAMAICGAYEPYLQISTMLLMQAATAQPPSDDDDLIAFINSLRLSILDAYSGIIFGLSDGQMLHLFLPNVSSIMQFMQVLAAPESCKDDDVLQKAVTLLGDMGSQMGPQVKAQLNQPCAVELLDEAIQSPDNEIRDTGVWTRQVLEKLMASA